MKKLLALVLALVMTMSLVTISNAAFKDANSIDYKEAVEVMNKVGVLIGDEKGNFNAKDTLTRAQAAKIIAYLDLGGKTADAIKGTGAVFTDVKASDWFAGFVEYCAGAGYVAGVGDKKFAPNEKVTGVQFAKMLLCALGYSAEIEGYTGADYTIAIARDANKNDLYKDLSISAASVLTREQAAQMAFNTLQATCVKYEGGTSVSTSDGTKVVVNAKREEVTNASDYRTVGYAAADRDDVQQLCEKLYGGSKGLKKVKVVDSDDFGRALSYKWTYDGKDAYTVYKTATFTFTAKAGSEDLAKAMKGYKMNAGGIYKITSDTTTAAIEAASGETTANGKVVEYFFDDNNVFTDAISITYDFGKVSSVKTNKDGDITYRIDGIGGATNRTGVAYADENKDDTIVLAGAVAKDDYVTYVVAGSKLYVYPTTKVTGVQTAFNANAGKESVTVAGNTYKLASGVTGVSMTAELKANSDKAANFYLDQYGFVLYAADVTAESKYAGIDLLGKAASSLSSDIKAKLVFADGTAKEVTVSKISVSGTELTTTEYDNIHVGSGNTTYEKKACKYSIDDDGKYELDLIGTSASAATYSKGQPTIAGVTTGDSTVFVVKTTESGSAKYNAYVGFKAMPKITGSFDISQVTDDGDVVFVYVDASSATVENESDNASIVYVTNANYTTSGKSGKYVYSYEAIVNGVKGTLTTKTTNAYTVGGDATITTDLYKVVTVNDKGEATKLTNVTADLGFKKYTEANGDFNTVGDAKDGVLKVGSDTYTYDGSETVYVIDADGNVTEGSAASIKAKKVDGSSDISALFIKVTETGKISVKTIYVIEK